MGLYLKFFLSSLFPGTSVSNPRHTSISLEMAIMPLISASMTSSPNFLTRSFCHSFSILNSLLERRVLWACTLFDLNPLQRFHLHLQRIFFAKIGRAKFRKASCRVLSASRIYTSMRTFNKYSMKNIYPCASWLNGVLYTRKCYLPKEYIPLCKCFLYSWGIFISVWVH